MKERKYKITQTLKKSDCIELLKKELNFEELKTLINPNFNQLIRILNCMNKKELQYVVFNHEKLTIDKITDIIRKTALEEKNTINKNFNMTGTNNDSEEENNEEENISVIKIDNEKKMIENISYSIPAPKKIIINELVELNNVEEIEVIKKPTEQIKPPQIKPQQQKPLMIKKITAENVDTCFKYNNVYNFLQNNGLNEEEITAYFEARRTELIKKYSNHKDYGKYFTKEQDIQAIYEIMNLLTAPHFNQ